MRSNTTTSLFSDESRLAILKATQNNEKERVAQMLRQEIMLIKAKTTSMESTLLHIAAERGHLDIVELLLKYSHEPNPVDKQGKTPYQRTQSGAIKKLLVEKQLHFLANKYYSYMEDIRRIKTNFDYARQEFDVMDPKTFINFVKEHCRGESAHYTFAGSMFRKNESANNSSLKSYTVKSTFREDILMTPYYGDLIMINQNNQASAMISIIYQNVNSELDMNAFISHTRVLEAQAYIEEIRKGINEYPFLSEPLRPDDSPAISEAKKLFIAFTLMGFAIAYKSCTNEQILSLSEIRGYEIASGLATSAFPPNNPGINNKILEEMLGKYVRSENQTTSSLTSGLSKN